MGQYKLCYTDAYNRYQAIEEDDFDEFTRKYSLIGNSELTQLITPSVTVQDEESILDELMAEARKFCVDLKWVASGSLSSYVWKAYKDAYRLYDLPLKKHAVSTYIYDDNSMYGILHEPLDNRAAFLDYYNLDPNDYPIEDLEEIQRTVTNRFRNNLSRYTDKTVVRLSVADKYMITAPHTACWRIKRYKKESFFTELVYYRAQTVSL